MEETVKLIIAALDSPDCRTNEDKVDFAETCIGALGKIVYFQNEAPNFNAQMVGAFIGMLPLKECEDETQPVHKLFLEQVLAGNPVLAQHETAIKETIGKIRKYDQENPEKEILDDKGKELLRKFA